MRTIKFRAWDKKDKAMSYEVAYWGGKPYEGEIIMQFTGLKDKNGKEIYEGDIIQYPNPTSKGVVIWETREIAPNDWYGMEVSGFYVDTSLDIEGLVGGKSEEVIGNRFENPELLK